MKNIRVTIGLIIKLLQIDVFLHMEDTMSSSLPCKIFYERFKTTKEIEIYLMSLLLKLYVEIKKIKESYIYFSFINSIVTINVNGDMNP